MDDAEYIEGLEFLVSILADVYQKNFDKFYWKNFETCSITNPNRRDLTELEKEIIMTFTTFQGGTRSEVKKMSKIKITQPKNINKTIEKFLELKPKPNDN